LRKKVEDTHKESIDYHAALRQQILGLREMIQMSKRNINLTKALKVIVKCKVIKGELGFRTSFRKSGLEKEGAEVQQAFTTRKETVYSRCGH
jgi:DNA recombination protein RmuC